MSSHLTISKKRKFSYFIIAIIAFAMIGFPFYLVSATNDWQVDNKSNEISYIIKPVDPVFINVAGATDAYGEPIYVNKVSVPIPLGDSWSLNYLLEKGKRYHVFLVGDWICNTTTPTTDYDIRTHYPEGTIWAEQEWWNTESAGLPEQVAFDDYHHYFIPPVSGNYTFEIINDDRDSRGDEPAIFMLIENIDKNTWYSQELEGRKPDKNGIYKEVDHTSWAVEFTTSSPKIRVLVDVPDSVHEPERGHLDMYEARLYAMANPDAGVGYTIDGIGVPSGNLFNRFAGYYGGFNTSCNGDRNMDALASCEYPGADMEFTYDNPAGENSTSEITYFLVLIAEHGEGSVDFLVQTDFQAPNITLVDPPMTANSKENTAITVELEEEYDTERVWVEFSNDDGKTWDEVDFSKKDDAWIGAIPPFTGGDYVNYTIYSEDEFGNVGSLDSGYLAKDVVTIECNLEDQILTTGEDAIIYVETSNVLLPIQLRFTCEDVNETYSMNTDESGLYDFIYRPNRPGLWTVQSFYDGSDTEFQSESDPVTFEKLPVSITCNSLNRYLKGDEGAEIRGSSSLKEGPLTITFTNGIRTSTLQVLTDENGNYECSFTPDAMGDWTATADFLGDDYDYPATSNHAQFNYESWSTHISMILSLRRVKVNRPVTITGSVAPTVKNLPVSVLFVSSSSSDSDIVLTAADGSFEYTFNPPEVGIWNVNAKVGDGLIYSISNNLMEFEVLPLNMFDKASMFSVMMITPPYLYMTVGLFAIGISSVIYIKRESLIRYLPKSLAQKIKASSTKKKKKSKGGGQRYKRKGK
ncbi:MAG TPA: Ig-like domain-containing protein [Patescibacteria group bacterium]|nr:Ig-like domain-containing protein [Patescibacteria group bacterium]